MNDVLNIAKKILNSQPPHQQWFVKHTMELIKTTKGDAYYYYKYLHDGLKFYKLPFDKCVFRELDHD